MWISLYRNVPDYVVGRSPPEADNNKNNPRQTLGQISFYRYTLEFIIDIEKSEFADGP